MIELNFRQRARPFHGIYGRLDPEGSGYEGMVRFGRRTNRPAKGLSFRIRTFRQARTRYMRTYSVPTFDLNKMKYLL